MIDLKTYIEIVRNKFHLIWAFLLMVAVTLIFFTTIDGLLSHLGKPRFFVYGVVFIGEILFWAIFKWRLPRNKKDKVGIVVGIFCKDEKEKNELKDDFISKIHKNFQDEKLLNTFHLIFLENHFAEQIKSANNPAEFIKKINKKIRAHYFVWGEIKKKKDGDEKYFFDLNGYVVHRQIPKEVSQNIAEDFSKILPKKIEFVEKFQLKGFEISADFVYLSIKYIVGFAAFVSGDLFLAEQLHRNLYQQFNTFRPLPDHLRDIRTKSFNLFIDEKYLLAYHCHLQGKETKLVRENIDFVLKHIANHYSALLLGSQLDFLDGNIEESIKKVCRARDCSKGNTIWQYNLAFLYFWNDQVDKALKICKQIQKNSFEGELKIVEEVVNFNLEQLKKDPQKVQLYFWIGYLTYWKLDDLANALIYFENYKNGISDNSNLKTKADNYLSDIEKKMGLTGSQTRL